MGITMMRKKAKDQLATWFSKKLNEAIFSSVDIPIPSTYIELTRPLIEIDGEVIEIAEGDYVTWIDDYGKQRNEGEVLQACLNNCGNSMMVQVKKSWRKHKEKWYPVNYNNWANEDLIQRVQVRGIRDVEQR